MTDVVIVAGFVGAVGAILYLKNWLEIRAFRRELDEDDG